MFRRKGKKLEKRTESDGQKIHLRKKGQSQKHLWGNDLQSIRQTSEKGTSEAAEPPDQSTPVVGVKTLISLMLSLILSIEEIVLVASEHFQKDS